MFFEARDRFLRVWETLRPKWQNAFLAGKITYTEAQAFSERSRLGTRSLCQQIQHLHNKRHEKLMQKYVDLPVKHKDVYSLTDEIDCMPGHIAMMVLAGQLTLLQARFAARSQLGAKSTQELARANAPTQPYRARKYRLGSERSVRAHIVRVRPHLSHYKR